jgi:predicted dehydrogenase
MIHDLDVVLSLVDSDVESIEAVGVPVLTEPRRHRQRAAAFANGCIANLTASRISRDRVRKIRFFQPRRTCRSTTRRRRSRSGGWCTAHGADAVDRRRRARGPNEEPLKRELADFVDASSRARAPVTGEAGRRALALAQQIAIR